MQCQKRLADVLGPINREPPLTAFSCQGGLQQYGSQQNGGWNFTMCAVNVIPASVHTKRFMDKKLDKNIIPMVSM